MAIAYDNSAQGFTSGGSTLTIPYVATTTNPYLVLTLITFSLTDTITGVTFNGSPMTRLLISLSTGVTQCYVYGIAAGGSHDVVISQSGASPFYQWGLASYSGVNQVSSVDGTPTRQTGTLGASVTKSYTTTVANDWIFNTVFTTTTGRQPTASTGTTGRQSGVPNDGQGIGDSGGPQSIGSYSMSWTVSGGNDTFEMLMGALSPAAGASVNSGFFMAASR